MKFILPPGILVSGNLTEPQMKDMQGAPKKFPNLWFAVAVPKNHPVIVGTPQQPGLLLQILNFGVNAWRDKPHIVAEAQKGIDAGRFAWKISDGDSPKWANKPGCANCWIFKYSTTIMPLKTADANNNPIDPHVVKLGYWVDVSTSIASNEIDAQPGIYMNPMGLRLLGYGPEIQPGPSIDEMFAGQPGALPPGASATPVAPAAPQGWTQQQQPQATQPGWPVQPAPQPQAPQGWPQQQPQATPQGWPQQQPQAPQPQAAPQGWPQQQQPQGWPPQQPQAPQPQAAPQGWPPQQQPQAAQPGWPVQQATVQDVPDPAGYAAPQGWPPQQQPQAAPQGWPQQQNPMAAGAPNAAVPATTGNPASGPAGTAYPFSGQPGFLGQ